MLVMIPINNAWPTTTAIRNQLGAGKKTTRHTTAIDTAASANASAITFLSR